MLKGDASTSWEAADHVGWPFGAGIRFAERTLKATPIMEFNEEVRYVK
jgi:hypothetical protein